MAIILCSVVPFFCIAKMHLNAVILNIFPPLISFDAQRILLQLKDQEIIYFVGE